jgi:peptide chain release factor 1
VTDHRLKLSLSNLPGVLSGNIDEFISDLQAADEAERLQEEGLN